MLIGVIQALVFSEYMLGVFLGHSVLPGQNKTTEGKNGHEKLIHLLSYFGDIDSIDWYPCLKGCHG